MRMSKKDWKVLWHPKALKNLEKLPKDIIERVVKRIDKLQDNPFIFLNTMKVKVYKRTK